MDHEPDHLQLELTNACNLDCAMCARSYMARPIAHLSVDLFRRILDEIQGLRWPLDWLHHMGEPLLWRHLPMVGYAFAEGLSPTISTNGVALTENTGRLLLDAGCRSVLLCMDSARRDVYRTLRGNQFDLVVENSRRFIRLRNSGAYDCDIYVQWLHTRHNTDEGVEGLVGLFGESVEYVCKSCDRILHSRKNHSLRPDDHRSTARGCPRGLRGCCILADGTVTPCCWDYDGRISLGNLNQQALVEVYYGDKARAFRESLTDPDHALHQLCGMCVGQEG